MAAIPERQLSRLSAFIASRMGLHFPEERRRNLERGINSAAREFGFEDGDSCIEWLLSSSPTRSQVEILASHLTIQETYFFRDKRLFNALEELVLFGLIQSRRDSGRHLRIWSAGCSSGEEPYSIAILLSIMIPDIRDWNVSILATDINARHLRKAACGVYGQWSFRDVQPEVKEGFFHSREKGRFELLPRIRKMVHFSYLNMVEDPYPSLINGTTALDLVVCRNVLMYFVPELANRVVRNLHRSLADGGFLIVSPAESSKLDFSQFAVVRSHGTILHKKDGPQGGRAFPARSREKSKPGMNSTFQPVPKAARVPEPVVARPAPPPEAQVAPLESPVRETDDRSLHELHRQAIILFEGGFYSEAVERTEGLLDQNPSDAEGLALLARIYANWGKLEKALEYCEKATSAEKFHAGYHYLMATVLQELGRTEDAVVSLRRTLYLDTKFILAYVALGNISRKCGKHKESVKHFENALSLLNSQGPEDILPELEGINAHTLTEIIKTLRQAESGR